jgi:hypothetical protein
MSDRNWEAELAKIDKQLASVSDEALLAEKKPVAAGKASGKLAAPAAPARASAPASAAHGREWTSWLKVSIAVAAAAGLMFWPWPARCGLPLVGFTAATGGVAALGLWSAVGTWRHRLGLAHVASLVVTVWGLVLGAREVLPRVGYAVPSAARAGQWTCEGLPTEPSALPGSGPTGTPPSGSPTATPPAGTSPGAVSSGTSATSTPSGLQRM